MGVLETPAVNHHNPFVRAPSDEGMGVLETPPFVRAPSDEKQQNYYSIINYIIYINFYYTFYYSNQVIFIN